MTDTEHVLSLGKLLGNFHALEMSLRAFLSNRPGATQIHAAYGTDILALPVGSELPESDLTSHAYLSKLVQMFNALALQTSSQQIDPVVVQVRNTLMHGCVFGRHSSFPVHILKFSTAKAGKVTIAANEAMSPEWFKAQHTVVTNALKVVIHQLEA